MRSISEAVEEIVRNSPFLEEALGGDIINLSALARKIHREVEAKVKKSVKSGAITMALRRLSISLDKKDESIKVLKKLSDLTVRSRLVEFTFANSETLIENQKHLFEKIKNKKDVFCNVSQGVFETTIIINENFATGLEEIYKKEKLIFKLPNLSSITLKLPVENVETPGVYYSILKQLAWEGINLVEVSSTYTELTLILHEKDINRAFTIIHNFVKGLK